MLCMLTFWRPPKGVWIVEMHLAQSLGKGQHLLHVSPAADVTAEFWPGGHRLGCFSSFRNARYKCKTFKSFPIKLLMKFPMRWEYVNLSSHGQNVMSEDSYETEGKYEAAKEN
jgi:hypothetical protein